MSWWNRHRPQGQPRVGPASPTRVELIPGQLAANIYQHDLVAKQVTLHCWTYVTDGLQRVHQAEVSMTLLRHLNTAAPEDPLDFFPTLHQLASQGQFVEAGAVSQFGGHGFLGRHLAYIPAQPLGEVTLPPSAIIAISVTEEELTAVKQFGILRVMARLGWQARYYPCPPWIDPARPGLAFAKADQESFLRGGTHCTQLRVLQARDHLQIRLSPTRRSRLAEALTQVPEHMAAVFLTALDPSADGCLVWGTGQKEPFAITPPDSRGQRLCGCFVVFAPEQETSGGQGLEDGFVVTLTAGQWPSVRQALLDGRPMQVGATEGRLPVRIEWDS